MEIITMEEVINLNEDERLLEEFDELNAKIDCILLSEFQTKGLENITEEESEQYE